MKRTRRVKNRRLQRTQKRRRTQRGAGDEPSQITPISTPTKAHPIKNITSTHAYPFSPSYPTPRSEDKKTPSKSPYIPKEANPETLFALGNTYGSYGREHFNVPSPSYLQEAVPIQPVSHTDTDTDWIRQLNQQYISQMSQQRGGIKKTSSTKIHPLPRSRSRSHSTSLPIAEPTHTAPSIPAYPLENDIQRTQRDQVPTPRTSPYIPEDADPRTVLPLGPTYGTLSPVSNPPSPSGSPQSAIVLDSPSLSTTSSEESIAPNRSISADRQAVIGYIYRLRIYAENEAQVAAGFETDAATELNYTQNYVNSHPNNMVARLQLDNANATYQRAREQATNAREYLHNLNRVIQRDVPNAHTERGFQRLVRNYRRITPVM